MTASRGSQDSPPSAAEMASLYPFLYAGEQGSLDAVLAEVRQSTAAKAAEIVELRSAIARRDAAG